MNTQLKKGFIYTAIGTYSNVILQLVIQMVLSRLLTPSDYGIVAIMQVFIVFFALIIEAGMGPAIIQNKNLRSKDNRILFNYSAIFALALAVLFGFFGILLSIFYSKSIYLKLTWIQSLSVFFNGMNIVPTALLYKKKRFKAVNFSIIIGNLVAAAVGVTLALLNMGVYALIFSAITSSFISFMFNRSFSNLKFSRSWDRTPLKSIFEFSKNQFGFNFINYFSRNADNILIGKLMGDSALANYNKSYQLLLMPTQLIANIITPVLQPILSEYQDDIEYIRSFYLKLIHIEALIGIPLSIFLSFSSKPIIFILFGNQWKDAILPFSILSLTVWIQITISSTGAILQSRNQSALLLKNGIYSAIIIVSSIVIGVVSGTITSVASCYSLGALVVFFISFYYVVLVSLNGNWASFLREFLSPTILGVIMLLVMIVVNFVDVRNLFLSLLIRGVVFFLTMFVYIYFSSEKDKLRRIFKKGIQ